jgi:hypothetical protein
MAYPRVLPAALVDDVCSAMCLTVVIAAMATTNATAAMNTVKIRRGLISSTPRLAGHDLTPSTPSFNRRRPAIRLRMSHKNWVVAGPDVRPVRQNGPWSERPGSFFFNLPIKSLCDREPSPVDRLNRQLARPLLSQPSCPENFNGRQNRKNRSCEKKQHAACCSVDENSNNAAQKKRANRHAVQAEF